MPRKLESKPDDYRNGYRYAVRQMRQYLSTVRDDTVASELEAMLEEVRVATPPRRRLGEGRGPRAYGKSTAENDRRITR